MTKLSQNGNRILGDRKKIERLKMLESVRASLDTMPVDLRSNHYRMLQLELKFSIADLKNSLYGEQTHLTIISNRTASG